MCPNGPYKASDPTLPRLGTLGREQSTIVRISTPSLPTSDRDVGLLVAVASDPPRSLLTLGGVVSGGGAGQKGASSHVGPPSVLLQLPQQARDYVDKSPPVVVATVTIMTILDYLMTMVCLSCDCFMTILW